MPKQAAPSGSSVSLFYVSGEVFNIPARDLSPDDLKALSKDPWVQRRLAKDLPSLIEALTASGVYKVASEEKE